MAFEDSLSHAGSQGFKGHIEEGQDVERAIAALRDNKPKELNWGSYEFKENEGRGKSTITIGKKRVWLFSTFIYLMQYNVYISIEI